MGLVVIEILVCCVIRYKMYRKRRQKYSSLPDATTETLEAEGIQQMSESNIKQLARAYRHPFEYISPRLYSLNDNDIYDDITYDMSSGVSETNLTHDKIL